MSQEPENNVVVATRFSRLRGGRVEGEAASNADVGYEALAALSEAMDLLGDVLKASSAGTPWDFERNERLERRVAELLQCLDGRTHVAGTAATENPGAAAESADLTGTASTRTIRDRSA